MSTPRVQSTIYDAPIVPSLEPCWYAAYTTPRHEKSVLRHLEVRSVESFLPLYKSVRMWNRRQATVHLPLFPGYIFVRIPASDRMRVLEAPGVLNILGTRGQLTPLPEGTVEALRATLAARNPQPHPFLSAGNRVRITAGPMCGLEGVVLRVNRELRMVVSLETIMQSFIVELQADDLELCAA